MSHECLNCTAPLTHNYCPHCGQKSSTHRYSIPHFFEHDLVHGVFHVDKGILFTLVALFTRPGHSVREFIQGKRVSYFSFVTLILLILTVTGLIAPYTHGKMSDLAPEQSKAMMNDVERLITTYPKLVMIITIPIYSLFSFLWFRKAKLNFSEHLVMNSYRVIPEMLIGLLFAIISIYYTGKHMVTIQYVTAGLFGIFYSIYFYYQFFSSFNYSKKAVLFRSIMIYVTYLLISFLVGFILAAIKKMH